MGIKRGKIPSLLSLHLSLEYAHCACVLWDALAEWLVFMEIQLGVLTAENICHVGGNSREAAPDLGVKFCHEGEQGFGFASFFL